MTQATAVCSRCGKAKPLTSSEFVNGKAMPLCADCHRDKKLATMVRMIVSDNAGLAKSAMLKFAGALQNAGPEVAYDIADRIEHAGNGAPGNNGQLPEAVMQEVFDAGVKEGLKRAAQSNTNGVNMVTMPSAADMAMFCYRNIGELRSDWEREFVTNMASWTRTRALSLKQQAHLEKIYLKLGGRV